MLNKKNPDNSLTSEEDMEESDQTSNTDNDTDVSDSESDDNDIQMNDDNIEPAESDSEETVQEEEEEDETVKAILRECKRERDHPPPISCEDFITDLSFHPRNDIIAVATIVGDALLYKYSNEENSLCSTLELHTRSCRDIEFNHDGSSLFSCSKDKSITISDVESEKLVRFYDGAHDAPLYCLSIIDENLFATGDDDGTIKMWDIREKESRPIYKTKKNEDYISDITTNESKDYLVCASGDGSILSIDLKNRKIHLQSEEYEEEITCLGLFRTETKLVAGSANGKLYVYNWQEFGLHSDSFPGPKTSINDLIPITENIVVTACEDGNLRASHLFPHRHLGIVGQHDLSVERVDICNAGRFVASSGHDNDVKFWNIQYFEDFDKVSQKHSKHDKKKEMRNNLPSSKIKNACDFFSDLC